MRRRPSIKGSNMAKLVEDVTKLLDSGRLPREEATRWLQPPDFELLGTRINFAHWYDLGSFQRMLELMRDVEGQGSNAYLRERGRRSAQRLLQAGVYLQLDYLHHTEVTQRRYAQERFEAFGRDLRMILTLAPSMINVTKWSHRSDPDYPKRYLLEVHEAKPMPEVWCWTTEGFVNGMAPNSGDAQLWLWRRPHPDLIVFHMTRDID